MTSLRTRRRARALGLRCLRVARKHHFSLVSLAILGATLTITLTSSSFEIQGNAPSAAAALSATASLPVASPAPAQPASTSDVEPRSVVYYFVSSQQQIDDMHQALHRDLVDEALVDYKPLHNVTRVFILVGDHRDEGDALELLRQQALIPADGYVVRVVDLR